MECLFGFSVVISVGFSFEYREVIGFAPLRCMIGVKKLAPIFHSVVTRPLCGPWVCAAPKCIVFIVNKASIFGNFGHKQGMALHSSLQPGMFFFIRSYLFIFIDSTINKSPSQIMFRTTAPATTVINMEYNFFLSSYKMDREICRFWSVNIEWEGFGKRAALPYHVTNFSGSTRHLGLHVVTLYPETDRRKRFDDILLAIPLPLHPVNCLGRCKSTMWNQ